MINRPLIKTPARTAAALTVFLVFCFLAEPSFESKHKQTVPREQYRRVKIYC